MVAKRDVILNIDPFEIKAIVKRLKQSNIEQHGAKLIKRLLRLAVTMALLLQYKNVAHLQ